MPDYLPRRDADLVGWTRVFAEALTREPERYHVTEQGAADYATLQIAFATALSITTGGEADSTRATVVKNEVRGSLVDLTRQLVGIIRSHKVGGEALATLGLRERKPMSSGQRPTSAPNIELVNVRGRFVTIQLTDPVSPSTRGMPRDVLLANVFYAVTDSATPRTMNASRILVTTSRARAKLTLPGDAGDALERTRQHVWLVAQWVGPRGRVGPMSEAIDITSWHRVMQIPSLTNRAVA